MDINSLRSTCCEERSSSRIPPDPNETSAMARHTPTQYSSDKYYFTTTLILTHFNPNLKYIIKTDLSNYILKRVLLQYNKNGKLYLIVFFF